MSEALIPIWVRAPQGSTDLISRACRMIAEIQVNIAYMTTASVGASQPALCCIDPTDQAKAETWIVQDTELSGAIRFGPAVGLLSLYPHQANLKVLGVALAALSDSGITIHGLASSISALTFVIDFDALEKAATILRGCMSLPRDPAPMRPEFKVRQEWISR
ncbi:MAG: hypothetical protein WAU91_22960 [Desulfatitalea sp.]